MKKWLLDRGAYEGSWLVGRELSEIKWLMRRDSCQSQRCDYGEDVIIREA